VSNLSLSIARYFPFARVVSVDQAVVELATHVEAVITLAPIEGGAALLFGVLGEWRAAARVRDAKGAGREPGARMDRPGGAQPEAALRQL
jgi:hypothetical protein